LNGTDALLASKGADTRPIKALAGSNIGGSAARNGTLATIGAKTIAVVVTGCASLDVASAVDTSVARNVCKARAGSTTSATVSDVVRKVLLTTVTSDVVAVTKLRSATYDLAGATGAIKGR